MLLLHKLSNVLFLWSGLFIDDPEKCPGFCVLFCAWWRFCLYLFNYFPPCPHFYPQVPNGNGFIYGAPFDRQTLLTTCRWDTRGGGRNLLRQSRSDLWPPGAGWFQGLTCWACLTCDPMFGWRQWRQLGSVFSFPHCIWIVLLAVAWWVFPSFHTHLGPQNMTIFGNRVFVDVI